MPKLSLRASLKRKTVHVFRQKIKAKKFEALNIQSKLAVYFTISHSVQTDLNIHICFVMRDTNAYGVPGSRGKVPKTPG
jgi:hypothetical protein